MARLMAKPRKPRSIAKKTSGRDVGIGSRQYGKDMADIAGPINKVAGWVGQGGNTLFQFGPVVVLTWVDSSNFFCFLRNTIQGNTIENLVTGKKYRVGFQYMNQSGTQTRVYLDGDNVPETGLIGNDINDGKFLWRQLEDVCPTNSGGFRLRPSGFGNGEQAAIGYVSVREILY